MGSRGSKIYTYRPPRASSTTAPGKRDQLRSVNAEVAAPRRRRSQSGGGTRVPQGPDPNTRLRCSIGANQSPRQASVCPLAGPRGSRFWGCCSRRLREPRAPHSPSAAARLPPAARPAGPAPLPGAPPLRPLRRRGRPTNRARARRSVSFRSASGRPRAISRAARGRLEPPRALWLAPLLGAGLTAKQL